MAINFPVNPVLGQTYSYGDYTYTYDGVKWTSVVKYGSSAVKIQSSTPPPSPEVGLQWYDDVSGRTYFWHVNTSDGIGQWVEDAPQGVVGDGLGITPSIVYVQEEMPTGPSIPSGARWYKPSETESYIYYVDPQGNKQWIEEDSVGDDGGSSFNFTQEDAPTERLFFGARWFKPSTSQEFIYYVGPNDVGVWTEANDTGDSASALGIETSEGDTVQQRFNSTSLEFDQISDVDGSPKLKLGVNITCHDYKTGNNSGVLFFKVVPAGTGINDGGKYIDLPSSGFQLEQNLRTPYNVKAWGAPLNGVDDDSAFVQNADNYIASLGGGLLTFPEGTLSIGSKINKSMFTHWKGNMTPNKFLASDTEYLRGTSIRPLYDGVLIETYAQTSDQVGFCGLENFACAGRLEETDDNITSNFDNVVVFRQLGERMKGLKFKNLIFKRVAKGLEINNASFCTFDHLDFRCRDNIDAPTLSDSEFIRCELGSGLPAGAVLKSFLSGGYGLRMIGDSSAGSAFNGNNRFHRCRFQLAASTFTNSRFEWMRNLKFFDCIFDQNESQGGVFLDCDEIEFYGITGFNNAESNTPKWTLQFGLNGNNGCTGVKFFGGAIYNKASPNANAFDGNGILFSDTSDYEMHGMYLDDTLVNRISGSTLSNKFYGGNINDYLSSDLVLQNSWVENSTASTPKVRKEGNICFISGAIKDGTRTNGTVIFTLPSGFRPSRTKYVHVFSGPATDPEYLTISTNGNVSISGGDWVAAALNGIDFSFDMVN